MVSVFLRVCVLHACMCPSGQVDPNASGRAPQGNFGFLLPGSYQGISQDPADQDPLHSLVGLWIVVRNNVQHILFHQGA
jgi:hypothetical protein